MRKILIFLPLLLCSCFVPPEPLDLKSFYKEEQSPKGFTVCHGFSCSRKGWVKLTNREWSRVKAPLRGKPKSAELERQQIAKSIARMEKITGKKVGTDKDTAGANSFKPRRHQLDCIDETANTTLYLTFLEDADLLDWHSVEPPVQRGRFLDGRWPHHTAVIKEKETGDSYVVDSWFYDNGEEPAIVSLEKWYMDWKPEGFVNGE